MKKENTEVKSQPMEKNPDKCKACQGYGWWPLGGLTSMGKYDSREWGDKCIKCPWCGAGTVDEGERWDLLVAHKKKLEEEE